MPDAGDATSDMHGDSTGFALQSRSARRRAGYGTTGRHDLARPHTISAVHGPMPAPGVTGSAAHDSPVFWRMFRQVPEGGGSVALDSAYFAAASRGPVTEGGRVPVTRPRKDGTVRGFTAIGRVAVEGQGRGPARMCAPGHCGRRQRSCLRGSCVTARPSTDTIKVTVESTDLPQGIRGTHVLPASWPRTAPPSGRCRKAGHRERCGCVFGGGRCVKLCADLDNPECGLLFISKKILTLCWGKCSRR